VGGLGLVDAVPSVCALRVSGVLLRVPKVYSNNNPSPLQKRTGALAKLSELINDANGTKVDQLESIRCDLFLKVCVGADHNISCVKRSASTRTNLSAYFHERSNNSKWTVRFHRR
jgi:hypothetical protein